MITNEIKNHKITSKKLDLIKDRVIKFIKKNINQVSEQDARDFILSEFEKENMAIDKIAPHFIVINEHTDDTHWSVPVKKPKIIGRNNLIMMDIWARLKKRKSPFADITWMFYSGKKIPKKIQETFDKVIVARDIALDFIREELKNKRFPEAGKVDGAVRNYFNKLGLGKFFTHKTGHSLGCINCHGRHFKLSKTSREKIEPNIPFTIEPGLYFKGKFGIRSEINCYITEDYKLIITSSVQKKIVKI